MTDKVRMGMKTLFKYASCLAFVGFCSQAVAHSTEERITELEQQMLEVGAMTPEGTYGASFTTASSVGQTGWYISVEPLYWHAKVGGTEYAYTDKDFNEVNDLFITPIKGRVKDQSFSWEWGVRAGLGRHFDHDNWDVNLNYTWYESNDSDNVSQRLPSAIVGLKSAEPFPYKSLKSHFDLSYNNVNFELGRNYFMSSKVSVNPHIGVKSTWIDERQKVYGDLADLPTVPAHIGVKTREKSIAWGLGPRAGIQVEGSLGDGFSLYGKLSGALLYSYFQSSYKQSVSNVPDNAGYGQMHFKGKNHLFMPTAQMGLGVNWETSINDKRQHVTLAAGYEVEYFWRANQMLEADDTIPFFSLTSNTRRMSIERTSEDVMFYGLTLKARLDF